MEGWKVCGTPFPVGIPDYAPIFPKLTPNSDSLALGFGWIARGLGAITDELNSFHEFVTRRFHFGTCTFRSIEIPEHFQRQCSGKVLSSHDHCQFQVHIASSKTVRSLGIKPGCHTWQVQAAHMVWAASAFIQPV